VLPIIDINTFFGIDRRREVDWTIDTLVRLLDKHGITQALTVSLRGVHFDFVTGNEETLAAAKRDARLIPVGTVDPRRYLDCREEVTRCFDEGLRIFRFFPDAQGWPVDGLHFLQVVELIAERKGAVLLPAAGCRPTAAARLLSDFGIPVVLLGAGYSIFGELLAAMVACPNLYCDGHKLNSPGAYELICSHVGKERLLFGSGLPEFYFSSAYLLVERSALTDEQRRAILHDNAARILLAKEV
jgi:predicted TIM-barrel fold metal-dependent hydrolase